MTDDPPFEPRTGNPEAHDYLDWYRHLVRTGQIVERPADEGSHSPGRMPRKPQDNPGSA